MDREELRFNIMSESDVNLAVIQTSKFVTALDCNETLVQMIMTTVSELAHNIVKYAGIGHIYIRKICRNGSIVVEIVAEDRGPGIKDIDSAWEDHFSTSGTLGMGLPGVKRLMDEFNIESNPDSGTRITVKKWIKDGCES